LKERNKIENRKSRRKKKRSVKGTPCFRWTTLVEDHLLLRGFGHYLVGNAENEGVQGHEVEKKRNWKVTLRLVVL